MTLILIAGIWINAAQIMWLNPHEGSCEIIYQHAGSVGFPKGPIIEAPCEEVARLINEEGK